MYPAILTTDLHLTDNPADEYRWGLFKLLSELRKEHKAKSLLVLGDITDAKDNHSARLVNRLVDQFVTQADSLDHVILNRGNHDYLQKEHTYLEFMDYMNRIMVVTAPMRFKKWVFIPHSRELPLWGLPLVDVDTTHCFLHQTVTGAMASNGQRMDGELSGSMLPFPRTCKYYSGDIHVPQTCGQVEYVGSPYPVHFGDRYQPRIIVMLDETRTVEHLWTGLQRFSLDIETVDDIAALDANPGDQIKVKVRISRADLSLWPEIRRDIQHACDLKGLRVHGLELIPPRPRRQLLDEVGRQSGVARDPTSILKRYAASQGIDHDLLQVGLDCL